MAYKRILTIQDISCVGQCSMTVALPILSACGHEVCILPTAVLSTHTGGFGKPAVQSLDEVGSHMVAHWKANGITFDLIYTGYLGSIKAIRMAEEIIQTMLAPEGITVVDPAMADHGKLYSGFDEDYARAMADLCGKADVMIPNITEAAMMTGIPYREQISEEYVRTLLDHLGGKTVVLTGIEMEEGMTGAAVRDGENVHFCMHDKIGKNYHGTGDIYASAFCGALASGRQPDEAAKIAGAYTYRCIRNTFENPAHWYGVKFETALAELIEMINS